MRDTLDISELVKEGKRRRFVAAFWKYSGLGLSLLLIGLALLNIRTTTVNTKYSVHPDQWVIYLEWVLFATILFFIVRGVVSTRTRRRYVSEAYVVIRDTVGLSILENVDPVLDASMQRLAKLDTLYRALMGIGISIFVLARYPSVLRVREPLMLIAAILVAISVPVVRQRFVLLLKGVTGRSSNAHPIDGQSASADPIQQPLSRHPVEQYETAIQAYRDGHYEFAERIFRSLTPVNWKQQRVFNVASLLMCLGDVLNGRELRDQAMLCYVAAVQLKRQEPLMYRRMAEHYQSFPTLTEPERALEWSTAAVSMLPKRPLANHVAYSKHTVWSVHALALANLGRADEARAATAMAVGFPRPPEPYVWAIAHYNCGRAALAIGDTAKARKYLETCATSQPELTIAAKARDLLATLATPSAS